MRTSRRSFMHRTGALAAAGALSSTPLFGGAAPAREPFARQGPPSIKVSCCAYSLRRYLSGKNPPMTMDDFLVWAAELDLDGVELTSYYFPPDADAAYFNRLKRRAFLLGLDVSATAVGNNFCLPPGPQRDKEIAAVKFGVDRAAMLGAPCVRVFAGGAPGGVSADAARQWVVEGLEACCAYAGERGVMLALENHGGLTADAEGVLAIAAGVASPWFGLNLDSGNFHSEDPYAELARIAPYTITAHIKVMVSAKGRPPEEADIGRVFSVLRDAGFRGYAALEYEESGEPKADSAKYLRVMQAAARAASAGGS
ncbi:MAG TPA: sugar phosphate isomerase/epimerase family protein [Planctomycetota bacterium]|nr:sugar phosphate isomerase/epimerase [Planctomycetota bacterium]OQC18974.1 MAG: Xylose isomerase-like TIM barrel [Planctomycetes bacterium ADurb.Bin069]NMD36157.1 sugar phosphate isomerase/epimerase [Planctomycetota bacterium]HNR97866.1 sugar phosphate isomerase/epimerase family protein [Planctomycetota bacterium]HNU27429.1 sugar phosphate isomerase/epimerase family protein [Planctomycetota bacterium]